MSDVDLPVLPGAKPMLAQATAGFPERDDLLFEPKWDGFRCMVFRDHEAIELSSRSQKPLNKYFPELCQPLMDQLPQRVVLDGEIVVPRDGRLDFDALGQRIHPAASRIARLAQETPARFVAFDLLAFDDNDLRALPFHQRRALLERLMAESAPPLHLTPATSDRVIAEDWFHRFEGAGFDGVIAKPRDGVYEHDRRVLLKIKHRRTADVVVGGYRLHKDERGVGSLLAGLFDEFGVLHHIGVITGFTQQRRTELLSELDSLECSAEDLSDHPWAAWAHASAHIDGHTRLPGAKNRWNATKDQSWIALRPELVAEVTFENLTGPRLRHPARMVRWRPDKAPQECRYDQLDQVSPPEFESIFGTG